MERDFLGLGSRNSPITVKEETSDSSKDSASTRAIGMQWSFSSKISATPQFLSFKPSSQVDRPRKSSNDHFVSSGFMPTSAGDAFDSNHKPLCNKLQSMQPFDAYTIRHAREARILPTSNQPNQTITVSMNVPSIQSHLVSGGNNFINHIVNPQPLGGVPILAQPVSVLPAPSSVVGTTDIRSTSKPLGAPAQLTIFYAGSVCVYDDVSPEKAQAIMLLAGNGSMTAAHNKPFPMSQVKSPLPCSPSSSSYIGTNSHSATPCSNLPSPMPAISYMGSQSRPSFRSKSELPNVKTTAGLSSSCVQTDPLKVSSSIGSAATNMIPSVALPQARKASLARFLEKRKERATSTSPYSLGKKFEDCGTPGSECVSSSDN